VTSGAALTGIIFSIIILINVSIAPAAAAEMAIN